MLCTYRWYWGKSEPKPAGDEIITVRKVGASYVRYDGPTLKNLKPGQCAWMYFPKASEFKADEKGFELYFPNEPKWGDCQGILMSRYEWLPVVVSGDEDPEASLRALWDAQGVPKDRQDEIIGAIVAKAQPGAKVGPFTISVPGDAE